MDRRGFIGVVGAAVLTGCSALGSTAPEIDGDAVSNTETVNNPRMQRIAGDLGLDAGAAAVRPVTPNRQVRYRVVTDTDAPLDVVTMERSELDRYREGDEALFFTGVSTMDTASASIDGSLGAGEYVLILDNSTWGEATPDGSVTGTFEVEISI